MAATSLARIEVEDARGRRADANATGVGETQILRSVYRILEQNRLCSIATVTSRNLPHNNTAYFCYSRQMVLYFLSHPNAAHCRNIRTKPSASATIFSADQPWGTPSVGVQLYGTCRPATGVHAREAERLYAKRFPAYRRWRLRESRGPAEREYRFYRLAVDRLKLLDEKRIGDGLFVSASVLRVR